MHRLREGLEAAVDVIVQYRDSLPDAVVVSLATRGEVVEAFRRRCPKAPPAALAFEEVAGSWLRQVLGVPESASTGFVTGAQAANTVGLAAARWRVLHDHGSLLALVSVGAYTTKPITLRSSLQHFWRKQQHQSRQQVPARVDEDCRTQTS